MRVTLLAHTYWCGNSNLDEGLFSELGWSPMEDDEDCDALAELAGRGCYESYSRPNKDTATNELYLQNILKQQHESVLEHASATFRIEGVSRSLTHELIRHRHLSFSQLSQRYVDESQSVPVVPPALEAMEGPAAPYALDHFYAATDKAAVEYMYLVDRLMTAGLPRKQAREAARAVLPNATETKIVVTGNMRAWRDVIKKRWHVAADAEIRQLAGELVKQLRTIAPNTFQDIPEDPYGLD